MEIILLEKVQNLGDLGEVVRVANGYARNFLIPQKKAMRATDEAKIEVEARRRQLAEEESKRREVAQARADLAIRAVTFTRLAGEGGKLYGSVSPADIAEALSDSGTRVEKAEVFQPDGPIKQTGEFAAEVILHAEVRFRMQITVLAEHGATPPAIETTSEGDATPPAIETTSELDAAEAPPPELESAPQLESKPESEPEPKPEP